MDRLIACLLIISFISGQIIKFPSQNQGLILIDIALLLLAILGFTKIRNLPSNIPIPYKLSVFFIFISFLSLFLTPLTLNSSEYLYSVFYTLRFAVTFFVSYLFFSNVIKLNRSFDNIFIYSGIIIAVIGIIQFLLLPDLGFLQNNLWDPHYFRSVSTFLDPNFLGAFLVLTLIFLFVKQYLFKSKFTKLLFLLIPYITLLLTFSRSSYLMFFISFTTISFIRKSKVIFLLTLVLFLGLLFGFWTYTQLISKPRNIDRQASASFRLNTWQQGLNIFQHAPILGVGFNSYRYAVREYNLADEGFLNARGSTSNDSSLLFILATTGIVGITTYLIFIGSLFKTSFVNSSKNEYALVLFASLSGLMIHSLFNNSLFYPFILVWIVLILSRINRLF